MREIKFRGKRVDNGDWVYGGYYTTNEGPYVVMGMHSFYPVIPETVGQYTGLKDKNGKEIWEGDILKGNHKDLFLIEEFNGGVQMYNSRYYGQRYNELIASPTCDPQTKSWLNNAEVIGNIHDNSELLIP